MNIRHLFSGSFLLVIDSFARKFVGLISTLILARVLTPEDFGIVAIAAIISNFLESFANVGTADYIVRSRRPTRAVINTAFTLNFAIRMTMMLAMVICAPFAADYFAEPQLTLLLYAYALIIAVEGLQNPAQYLLRRKQAYRPLIKVTIVSKVISVTVAITIALMFESFWALVLGILVSSTCQVVGSYLIYPYLPKLTTEHLKQQWQFSAWLIPQSIMGFGRTQFDTFIASTLFGKASLGSYNTLKYLAFIPSQNIITPLTAPLMAQLAPLRNNTDYFNQQFTVSTMISMGIAIPTSVFCFYFSEAIVYVLLGDQWTQYAELFGWFCVLISSMGLFSACARLHIIFAQTKPLLLFEIIALVLIAGPLVTLNFADIVAFTITKISVEVCLIILFFCYGTSKFVNVRATLHILAHTSVFLAAALAIANLTQSTVNFASMLASLLVSAALFACLFVVFATAWTMLTAKASPEIAYIQSLLLRALHKYLPVKHFADKEIKHE